MKVWFCTQLFKACLPKMLLYQVSGCCQDCESLPPLFQCLNSTSPLVWLWTWHRLLAAVLLWFYWVRYISYCSSIVLLFSLAVNCYFFQAKPYNRYLLFYGMDVEVDRDANFVGLASHLTYEIIKWGLNCDVYNPDTSFSVAAVPPN